MPDEVRQLAADGESLTVEFKRGARRSLSDSDMVAAVVCLANGRGGTLLLGVEDDGRITGLEPRHGSVSNPAALQAMILNNTEPPVATNVELVDVDGHEVAVIDVAAAASPVGTKAGLFIRRSTKADGRPECIPYRAHEIISAGLSVQGRDYADTPARGATRDDLDPLEFDRFRRLCETGKGDGGLGRASDEDILRALRLLRPDSNEPTLGAVLLFGSEPALSRFVPTAEILFQEMRSGALVTNEPLRMPLFRASERIKDLTDARNSEQELLIGMQRVVIPRLPDTIVRESVANALVHRDYSELGPITIRLDEERLRVTSPGGFPPGITLANLLEESKPRSVILADAFKRAGIVDRYGRGVQEMYLQLLRYGRQVPDYSDSNDKAVAVSLPVSDADLEMVRFLFQYEADTGHRLSGLHLRVLHELKAVGDLSVPDLAQVINTSESRVRTELARLTEMGLVEHRGNGRSRRHHLTAVFYRAADASAYVRMLDTDPIQQNQMVLSYVEQFGSITRAKTAQLCRLTPQQARDVLRRLAESGDLKLQGERRGSHYVMPHSAG